MRRAKLAQEILGNPAPADEHGRCSGPGGSARIDLRQRGESGACRHCSGWCRGRRLQCGARRRLMPRQTGNPCQVQHSPPRRSPHGSIGCRRRGKSGSLSSCCRWRRVRAVRLLMTGYVAPGLVRSGIFSPGHTGLFGLPDQAAFASVTFAGLFIGTICFGYVADSLVAARSSPGRSCGTRS